MHQPYTYMALFTPQTRSLLLTEIEFSPRKCQ